MPWPEILKVPGKILGPWRSYPPGSIERAKSLGIEVKTTSERVDSTVRLWEAELEVVDRERPWEILGLPSRDAFIEAVTGRTDAEVRARLVERAKANPLRDKPGPPPRDHRNCVNNTISHGSTNTEYLLRRLARDFPETLDAFERGEYPSVRQAAIAAGIVKVPSQLDVLRKAWKKATDDERGEFLDWLQANA